MVKRNAQNNRNPRSTKRQKTSKSSFGPVATISTAPVAIGNSLSGSKPIVSVTANGCRVQGRDFAFQAGATANAVADWTLIGGLPLTPSVMPATALKSYAQMYGMFRFNAVAVHYITSSATSQTGDVMFYYEKDRAGPSPDNTNTSFLPFVLSDSNTVLGPQWINHTAVIKPDPEFKSTNYGMNADLNEEANGTVFLYSKTSNSNSPGYVVIDYDITFKQLQSNPRAGLLPVSRGAWSPVCLQFLGVATAGSSVQLAIAGNSVAGTATSAPTGTTNGDIYKVVLDVTNSQLVNTAWVGLTPANVWRIATSSGTIVTLPIDDGFTIYMTYDGTLSQCYVSLQSALTGSSGGRILWNTGAAAPNFNICASVSMVNSVNMRNQSSY